MKAFLATLSLILSLTAFGQGNGWELQSSPSTAALKDVTFTDSQNGWAVGQSGTILHTSNGGQLWQIQTSGTTKYLHSVSFANSQMGCAIGDSGLFLKTTNGGNTWIKQPYLSFPRCIRFFDANNGWIVTGGIRVYRTQNGGLTWTHSNLPDFGGLLSCHFISPTLGWGVGSKIYITTDGGETWQETGPQQSSAQRTSVFFVDSLTGWIGTGNMFPTMMSTTNGGATWNWQQGVANGVSDIHFTNRKTGWVAASGIKKTIDGGMTWADQYPEELAHKVRALHFTDSLTGWAVGFQGTILHTVTGGEVVANKTLVSSPTFSLYPNPAGETIQLKTESPILSITITDAMGRKCSPPSPDLSAVVEGGANVARLDVSGLKPGMYYVRIQTAEGTAVQKVVKE